MRFPSLGTVCKALLLVFVIPHKCRDPFKRIEGYINSLPSSSCSRDLPQSLLYQVSHVKYGGFINSNKLEERRFILHWEQRQAVSVEKNKWVYVGLKWKWGFLGSERFNCVFNFFVKLINILKEITDKMVQIKMEETKVCFVTLLSPHLLFALHLSVGQKVYLTPNL